MRRVVTAIVAMTCFAGYASAQGQPPQPSSASVGFHNQTNAAILIKGYTIVNGVQRAGPLVQVKNGSKGFESNVPAGIRYYTVYDANQPGRILLQDHAVPVRNSIVLLNIVPSPTNPNRVMIVPAGPNPGP